MSFNEYFGGPAPKIQGVLSSVKLRNQLLKLDSTLDVRLKNVRVNGQLRGCSGFVGNGTSWVYVNAEHDRGISPDALYRTATGPTDYTGGRNQFAPYGDLAWAVVSTLKG